MTLPLAAGTWTLDSTHTSVEFSVRHLAISKVRGRFSQVDATVNIGDDLTSTTIRAEVDLSSVDTGSPERDAHLRSADFFGVDAHPSMVFESSTVAEAGDGAYRVEGVRTLNGRTNPLVLDVTFFGSELFPGDGLPHAGFAATGSVSRKALGVDFNVPMGAGFVIGHQVMLDLDVQLRPAGVATA